MYLYEPCAHQEFRDALPYPDVYLCVPGYYMYALILGGVEEAGFQFLGGDTVRQVLHACSAKLRRRGPFLFLATIVSMQDTP